MMDINDVKAVIKGLQEKPFICSENAIKTDNGYVIKRIPQKYSKADKIRSMNDEELAEFLEKIVSGNRDIIGINCGNSKCESWKCTECISMWLQSKAE